MSATVVRPGPIGRVLRMLCQISATIGGLLLVGIALMTLASVAGRVFWSSPILGDVEVVQLACAIALACFLPYTQWQGTNIMVDFFTTRASEHNKRRLDAFGALLLALVTALVPFLSVTVTPESGLPLESLTVPEMLYVTWRTINGK